MNNFVRRTPLHPDHEQNPALMSLVVFAIIGLIGWGVLALTRHESVPLGIGWLPVVLALVMLLASLAMVRRPEIAAELALLAVSLGGLGFGLAWMGGKPPITQAAPVAVVVAAWSFGVAVLHVYRRQYHIPTPHHQRLNGLLLLGWLVVTAYTWSFQVSVRVAALCLVVYYAVPLALSFSGYVTAHMHRLFDTSATHPPTTPAPAPSTTTAPSAAAPASTADDRISDDPIAQTICKVIGANIKYEEWDTPVIMERDIYRGPQFDTYILRPPKSILAKRIVALSGIIEREIKRPNVLIGDSAEDGGIFVQVNKPTNEHWVIWYSDLQARQDVKEQLADQPFGVVVGVDARNRPFSVDMESEEDPHTLVAGMTGSGKSIMLHNIIVTLLERNSPRDLHLVFIDPKIVTGALYSKVPHLWAPVIEDIAEVPDLLARLDEEQQRRNNLLKKDGVTKARAYNRRHPDDPMSLLLVVIDEVTDLSDASDPAITKAYNDHVASLARKGRSVGIRLVLGVQRPSSKNVGFLRGQITRRIVMRLRDLGESAMAMQVDGDDSATRLLGKGDTLLLTSTMPMVRLKAPFLPEEEIKARPNEQVQLYIADILKKWGQNDFLYGEERTRAQSLKHLHNDSVTDLGWLVLEALCDLASGVDDPDRPLSATPETVRATIERVMPATYRPPTSITAAMVAETLRAFGLRQASGGESFVFLPRVITIRRDAARSGSRVTIESDDAAREQILRRFQSARRSRTSDEE